MTTKCDTLYKSDDPNETTFKYDESLPSLPVPSLEVTVEKLLDSIKPLVVHAHASSERANEYQRESSTSDINNYDEQFERVKQKAKLFLLDDNVQKLQVKLLERAVQQRNWLEQWWLEFAYLRNRKPLVPYSNMVCPLPQLDCWPPVDSASVSAGQTDYVRCERAALSLYYQQCFWKMLRHEEMRPMVHKGVPWSMSQFMYLFNTVRLPDETQDKLCTWFTLARDSHAPVADACKEVIVLHRGHIFAMKTVMIGGNGDETLLTPPQLERQLRYCEQYAREHGDGPGVSALTTGDRTQWAETYRYLERASAHNKSILERIARSLSVLVLDEATPVTDDEIYRQSLCGDPYNRWADKSITSLAFKNGTFGAQADHTPYDGFCTAIMTHYAITSVQEVNGRWDPKCHNDTSTVTITTTPQVLEFDLDAKLLDLIRLAHQQYTQACDNVATLHRTFKQFGKSSMKLFRIHPEAFVQCAIHLAYYRMHRAAAPTYVTATTRRFYRGRTETCRSCYPEMYAFVEQMVQQSRRQSSNEQVATALRSAAHKFQQVMSDACDARGCDRHLLGLYLMALLEGHSIPELFDDELVLKSSQFVLSTSCSGYWNVCGGIPPLIDDGYGVFYAIEDDRMTFCCTAYRSSQVTDVERFYRMVELSLDEMHRIMTGSKL